MRTWGRVYADDGTYEWVLVTTDENGFNDAVWLTTLAQCLKLQPNESPIFASYGISAQRAVLQQIMPDYDVAKTQAQFSTYFASLQIASVAPTNPNQFEPQYNISIVPNAGAVIPPNPVPK